MYIHHDCKWYWCVVTYIKNSLNTLRSHCLWITSNSCLVAIANLGTDVIFPPKGIRQSQQKLMLSSLRFGYFSKRALRHPGWIVCTILILHLNRSFLSRDVLSIGLLFWPNVIKGANKYKLLRNRIFHSLHQWNVRWDPKVSALLDLSPWW